MNLFEKVSYHDRGTWGLHLRNPFRDTLRRAIAQPFLQLVEYALKLKKLNRIYANALKGFYSSELLHEKFLKELKISWLIQGDIQVIPKEGPVVLLANHPFGILDGTALSVIFSSYRKDIKILTNFMIGLFPGSEKFCFFVNPFKGKENSRQNLQGLKNALKWLKKGHILGMFPAGEVARFDLRSLKIKESPWHSHAVRLIRKSKATVIPVYYSGRNSLCFYLSGIVHPYLAMIRIPMEALLKKGTVLQVRIGTPILPETIETFQSDAEITEYLKKQVVSLGQ